MNPHRGLWKRLTFEHSLQDVQKLIFWRDVACEFWVSTFLMAVVIIILTTNNEVAYKPNTTHFGLFAGFFIYMLLEAYGPISCLGHPPATFCFFISGKFSFARALLYTIAQVLGCATGSGIGYALTPVNKRNYVAFNPATNGLSLAQAVFCEALFTTNVLFVILSTHGEDYPRRFPVIPNLAIGCAVGTAIMAAGTFTGAFMNPLIALGPAILANDFSNHWIYWVGPYLGGVIGLVLYKCSVWIKEINETIPSRVIPASSEAELVESEY